MRKLLATLLIAFPLVFVAACEDPGMGEDRAGEPVGAPDDRAAAPGEPGAPDDQATAPGEPTGTPDDQAAGDFEAEDDEFARDPGTGGTAGDEYES